MNYDLILVGSGFASVFFLHEALKSGRAERILLLERGRYHDWEWQIRNHRNSEEDDRSDRLVERTGIGKRWRFNVGIGGGSNCWAANPMRFHPHDFDLRTRYGVGADWPLGYDELEPYYAEAETLMAVSGDDASSTLFPMSRRFPQPRHRFSQVSRTFKRRFPDLFFAMPQARARIATEYRNPCCSNHTCSLCPANAKFMIVNDMPALLDDPRVEVRTNAEVTELLAEGDRVTGVSVRERSGRSYEVRGDTVAVGANAIFNPFLLLKSGIDHGPVGLGINEQKAVYATIWLDGLEDGDGSSAVTGVGYNEIHGDFRKECSGGFYETHNLIKIRPEYGKWRSWATMTFLLEDLRDERNHVGISETDPDNPHVHFEGWSDYADKGCERIAERIPDLISHLPVEKIEVHADTLRDHAHIHGTTVMGNDPAQSVIDPGLVHHRYRNLLMLGSGAFPTSGWANPTLTICALSLRAAERYYG